MTTRTIEKMAAAILATRSPGKPKDEWALEAARNVAEVLRQGGDEIRDRLDYLSGPPGTEPEATWVWESVLGEILGDES